MRDLRVALVQSDLAWEDKEKNLRHFEEHFRKIEKGTDLVVLPEMFPTGFTMNGSRFFEGMDGNVLEWMAGWARKLDAALCGSVIVNEGGALFNRLVWMPPGGIPQTYDKKHLFSFGGETEIYRPGSEKLLVKWRDWRICPRICYDLRFPEWCRNTENYDLLLFVANWPEKRYNHWSKLLQARAIENQSFVLGVNRVGTDGNGIYHNGGTACINFLGECMHEILDQEGIVDGLISLDEQEEYRRSFPALRDMNR